MKKILNFFNPLNIGKGFKKIQNALAGKKTYLAAAILLLEGVMTLVEQAVGIGGTGELLNWISNIASSEGSLRIAEALAVFGIRSAIKKQ